MRDIRYKFYGLGSESDNDASGINLRQKAPIGYFNVKYQIFTDGYLGLGYLRAEADSSFEVDSPLLPSGVEPEFRTSIAGIEVPFQFDTRDSQMYPRDGVLMDVNGVLYRKSVGSDFDADKLTGRRSTVTSRCVMRMCWR